ncbi:unnamed protein product [Owenia fusiformis]|uniref:Trans-1,2-dihydrobenzene-1,2-diol dehydrogenase n=1 Tax=Owenia fusiformis TaxID=6347 RepID=A0A8J1XU77_OWEFU|nr:unnamed protein product [Owenia fusiformis]
MATRWGICTTGKISSDFGRAVQLLPRADHEIVGVAARKIEDAEKFIETLSLKSAKAYGSYKAMAEDSNVEVVYIGSIHTYHCELTKLFLNHGKHVLCEKPSAINSKQLDEMLTLAKEKKLFFMEGLWSRFFPAYVEMRKQIRAGAIGDVRYTSTQFGFPLDGVPRMAKKSMGGGSLLDLGIYPLHCTSFVFEGEKPERIVASAVMTDDDVDQTTLTTIHYSGGRTAQTACNMNVTLPNRAIICGTKGIIELKELFWCPTQVTINGETKHFELESEGFNFHNSAGLKYEAQAVRESLLKGELENSVASHAESRLLMSSLDQIRKQTGVVYAVDLE